MAKMSEIIDRLCRLSSEIEDIDHQLIQLQLRKDKLEAERKKLRQKRDTLRARGSDVNTAVGAEMTMNLLKKEVGSYLDAVEYL